MATTWARMQDLVRAQAAVYRTRYNPMNLRTGAKVLRQRLKGAAVAAYYPPRPFTMLRLRKLFPAMETYDEEAAARDDQLAIKKARGKGAPKKKRSAAESKRAGKKGKGGAPAKAPPAS